MDIRLFREEDRTATIALWEACELTRPWNNPDKDIDRKLAFQPELFFVGTLDSRLIASAMAGYDGHRGSVFYLAVLPEQQGKGYGQQLMTYIENRLTELGCPKLSILVRESNLEVIDFYRNLSYGEDAVSSLGKRLIAD